MTAVTEDVNVERKAVPGGCGEPLTSCKGVKLQLPSNNRRQY